MGISVGKLVEEFRLRGVHPQLILLAKTWGVRLPFDVLLTCGVRTNAEQAALYAQGRTKPGPIVTQAASASLSAHGRRWFNGMAYGCAVDAVPCTGVAGQPNYGDVGAYEAMAQIAERMGLEAGAVRSVVAAGLLHDAGIAVRATPDDAQNPAGHTLIRVDRQLLEEAYPQEIARSIELETQMVGASPDVPVGNELETAARPDERERDATEPLARKRHRHSGNRHRPDCERRRCGKDAVGEIADVEVPAVHRGAGLGHLRHLLPGG